ncbi:polysaccharide pyruvyl transferase family protein [Christensenella timonensis]|uniref:polysaccharide pyruvyl transferase family protein n=1 Tax=Christensenella timonensis TaxID=1816678 RepID=UPI00082FBFA8|nr:polysaccharide pyruvyl transferase family protein [Christensenella timonensis]
MKIGILTVYFADYGSYYQAVSLCKAIQSLGHECELINESVRYWRSPRLWAGHIGTVFLPEKVKRAIGKKVAAYNNYLNLQKAISKQTISEARLSIKKLSAEYDCVIIGSDELWSATNPLTRYVPSYFGYGLRCPRISYSTSGITMENPDQKLEQKMKRGLQSFTCLAVRDVYTQEWVERLSEKKCELVIDPTLLYPFFVQDDVGGGGYIAVYGEHFAPDQVEAITSYAQKNDILLKAISWQHDWCDEFCDVHSPEQLQQVFAKSEYSMVSTFHGTIFSMLHHRNFTAFTSQLRGKKIRLLLEMFGLQDRIFKGRILEKNIEYDIFEKTLEMWRKKSWDYLNNALYKIGEVKQNDFMRT